MLTRIRTWLRRLWREATRSEEEPLAPDFELWDIQAAADSGIAAGELRVREDLPTFDQLQEYRRAVLDAYQPKPVRGPGSSETDSEGGHNHD